jgi:hypothetical protein
MSILDDNERRLKAIAEALVQRETLNVDEVAQVAGLDDLDIDEEEEGYAAPRQLFAQGGPGPRRPA